MCFNTSLGGLRCKMWTHWCDLWSVCIICTQNAATEKLAQNVVFFSVSNQTNDIRWINQSACLLTARLRMRGTWIGSPVTYGPRGIFVDPRRGLILSWESRWHQCYPSKKTSRPAAKQHTKWTQVMAGSRKDARWASVGQHVCSVQEIRVQEADTYTVLI